MLVLEALALSKAGDSAGAIVLLLQARENAPLDEAATALLFTLLGYRGVDIDDDPIRLDLCHEGVTLARRPLQQSTWHLRRGLMHLTRREPKEALADLQRVLSLRASPDHLERARAGLLEVAALSPSSKRRT